VALRWKEDFLVPAKESLALTDVEEEEARDLSPPFAWAAAFSRRAWSFWALGLRPRVLISAGFGMKSLIGKSYNGGGKTAPPQLATPIRQHSRRQPLPFETLSF
jgi:hypothetical protein